MSNKTTAFIKFVTPVLIFMLAFAGFSPTGVQAKGGGHPVVAYATRSDVTEALSRMPQLPPLPAVLGQVFERPRKMLPNRQSNTSPTGEDPALQTAAPVVDAPGTGANFEGVNNVNGVLPPDTVGDIGPNHYVQMVNLSFAVYDRNGTKLYGPVGSNTLWQGFGGPCETTNDGDPVVLYDHLADRWLMTQFALPNYPRGPFYECVAVSQSPDPLGSWNRYEFLISNSKLDDYPKFGVWSDGYYMSINQFSCKFIGCSWAGAGAVAFERDAMLNGQAARMVYFDLYNVDPNLGGMLPADLDGPPPAAGTPNPFAQMDDNAWGYSGDQLQVWNFHVDWSNPANSTFTFGQALPVSSFDSDMCGYARNCIPQPGGTNVDALSDRLMFRLQYRNFGTHQTMVLNHTVDANGADRAGVRWYELRNTGSGWSVYQQATYSPDAANRWVGSVAMNGAGDIGLGYSVSSTSISPSIRFTGRLAGDPLNQMTQGEGTIINGSGYQTHTSGRWGDYAMMAVDPVDDCTFWFTTEYYNSVSSAGWQTRVGSFQLASCGGPTDLAPTVTVTSPTNGSTVSGTVNVTANASDDNGVTQVEFFVDGSSIGTDTTAPYAASWNTTGYSDGAHTVSATATDTIGQTGSNSVNVTVQNASVVAIHVGDLDATPAVIRKNWNATVTITVHDAGHNPVAGITVTGSWSGGTTGTSSCVTNASGQCSVTSSNMNSKKTSVTFTVTGLSGGSGYTYNSSANHDPDGDSNGTSITVAMP
ncbi:MAG: hypothetical protein FIB03_05145 [Anaerolineae bacterium]|nr:hypothetical protein [Anaerolineae bacterium]